MTEKMTKLRVFYRDEMNVTDNEAVVQNAEKPGLYVKAVDAHVDDHFGGELTTAQMVLRDQIVFGYARRTGKPLVWNLAGGYQEPYSKVLALHRTTTKICLEICKAL